jgi:A/G-specific adenine glycosylase
MMELGAMVCTPRGPACLTCPVVDLCATRGELTLVVKAARQKKREVHYSLACGEGKVFLVQRPRDARLMAGMWELPEMDGRTSADKARSNGAGENAALKALRHPKAGRGEVRRGEHNQNCLTLKHSITVTDYTVRVWGVATASHGGGEWIPVERLSRVALTGLARKILRKAEIIPSHPNGHLCHRT